MPLKLAFPLFNVDCGKAGDFRSITNHFRRRRASDYSYAGDEPGSGTSVGSLSELHDTFYSKQEVDQKMHDMNMRVREMKTLVDDMEHSMKKMKRNVSSCITRVSAFY